jgi:hypothetical protein
MESYLILAQPYPLEDYSEFVTGQRYWTDLWDDPSDSWDDECCPVYSYDGSNWFIDSDCMCGYSGGWVQRQERAISVDPSDTGSIWFGFAFYSWGYSDFSDSGIFLDNYYISATERPRSNIRFAPHDSWHHSDTLILCSDPAVQEPGQLYVDSNTYIDIGILNSSHDWRVTDPFRIDVYIDRDTSDIGQVPVDASCWGPVLDTMEREPVLDCAVIQVSTTGNHTVMVVLYADSTIKESDESDNVFIGTYTWLPKPPPDHVDLTPYTPSGRDSRRLLMLRLAQFDSEAMSRPRAAHDLPPGREAGDFDQR